MTLADEDTNSILSDNAKRAIQGNVAMQVTQPGGHLVAPFAFFAKLASRLHHCIDTLPWIALLALSVSIELVSSSARVTSVTKVAQSVTDIRTQRSDPRFTIKIGTILDFFLATQCLKATWVPLSFGTKMPC